MKSSHYQSKNASSSTPILKLLNRNLKKYNQLDPNNSTKGNLNRFYNPIVWFRIFNYFSNQKYLWAKQLDRFNKTSREKI